MGKEGSRVAQEITGLKGSFEKGRQLSMCLYIAGQSPGSGEKVKRREKREIIAAIHLL